ncbi:Cobalt-precorrin-6y C5-methyltransferase [Anaerovibrio sp. JC8]|uniref:precorrin-6y C5,15-methyltransferase (decarboxylating) subunit CbiE n=1 Tax=Anaerovibrio sp. JC8 TaxID=1240085 RepID=UPI000A09A683|nr:precorrin-6y C5,15-methyltransferase (decarboxylating) subunit CbiE [Anaerovibrio sp. JC8]ORT99547.1 Cobalt-precorrin-6y C5-methyltransferase [Anaerovibrio sp. JC8]
MEHKIIVVGIGPGSADYMIPAALKTITEAKVLVGGSRAIEQYGQEKGQKQCVIRADISSVMDFIARELQYHDVVVMVSGDPGYYSLLDAVKRSFEDSQIEVIPGLSAMQVAFCKLGLPWHNAELMSMHGRTVAKEKLRYKPGRTIGFLTDGKNNSKTIPALLLSLGWPADTMLGICSRLSYEDELIIKTTLGEAEDLKKTFLSCVLVVKAK